MVSQILRIQHEGDIDTLKPPTNADAFRAVSEWYQNTLRVFQSLKRKMPRYKNFIDVGETSFYHCLQLLKRYNFDKTIDRKSVSIAIKRPLPAELLRILGFLQYSGLIQERGTISRGEKGVFERYVIHYGAIIDQHSLFRGKGKNISEMVRSFQLRNAHEFTRTNISELIGNDYSQSCRFDMPPCTVCGASRVFEDARFCMNCGQKLTSASLFKELLDNPISELPLTERRIERIMSESQIRKIGDIILDHEHKELLKVNRIGPYWAEQIGRYAEEFVG